MPWARRISSRPASKHNPRLQKFIYVSSQAAAGPGRNGGKKKESDPCEPVSPYGRSKLRGEELALSHAHELPLLILRPVRSMGPGIKPFLLFFSVSPKGSSPVSPATFNTSACARFRIWSARSYWRLRPTPRVGKYFFCRMGKTTGWRKLMTSSHKRWR